jgi:hypothetical protein
MKGKYLVTTSNWFFAPDGKVYRAVWGDIEILSDSVLGVKTNSHSSNWFAKIGSEKKHAIIAGCQIQYAVKCEAKPNTEDVPDWSYEKSKVFERPTSIYIAE